MINQSLPKNGLLRKDQVAAGFSVQPDDHCIIIWRRSILFARYGQLTPAWIIHRDIDHVIEMEKVATMEPFKPEDFSRLAHESAVAARKEWLARCQEGRDIGSALG